VQDTFAAVHGDHERAAADGGEDQVDGAHIPSVSPVAAEEIGGRPQRGVAASLTPSGGSHRGRRDRSGLASGVSAPRWGPGRSRARPVPDFAAKLTRSEPI
jgi:hypothetical protein